MTYEEAITKLNKLKHVCLSQKEVDAVDLAIEALQKQVPMKAKVSHFEHDPGWGCGKIQCFEYHCPKCKKLNLDIGMIKSKSSAISLKILNCVR